MNDSKKDRAIDQIAKLAEEKKLAMPIPREYSPEEFRNEYLCSPVPAVLDEEAIQRQGEAFLRRLQRETQEQIAARARKRVERMARLCDVASAGLDKYEAQRREEKAFRFAKAYGAPVPPFDLDGPIADNPFKQKAVPPTEQPYGPSPAYADLEARTLMTVNSQLQEENQELRKVINTLMAEKGNLRDLEKVADEVFRFLGGLQMGTHSVTEQREYLHVFRKLQSALRSLRPDKGGAEAIIGTFKLEKDLTRVPGEEGLIPAEPLKEVPKPSIETGRISAKNLNRAGCAQIYWVAKK